MNMRGCAGLIDQPAQGRGQVFALAVATIECSGACARSPKIESQTGNSALEERTGNRVQNRIVHRSTHLRVRVRQQRGRAVGLGVLGGLKACFQGPDRPVDREILHCIGA